MFTLDEKALLSTLIDTHIEIESSNLRSLKSGKMRQPAKENKVSVKLNRLRIIKAKMGDLKVK